MRDLVSLTLFMEEPTSLSFRVASLLWCIFSSARAWASLLSQISVTFSQFPHPVIQESVSFRLPPAPGVSVWDIQFASGLRKRGDSEIEILYGLNDCVSIRYQYVTSPSDDFMSQPCAARRSSSEEDPRRVVRWESSFSSDSFAVVTRSLWAEVGHLSFLLQLVDPNQRTTHALLQNHSLGTPDLGIKNADVTVRISWPPSVA